LVVLYVCFFLNLRDCHTWRACTQGLVRGSQLHSFFCFFVFMRKDAHSPASRRDATQSPLLVVRKLVAQKKNNDDGTTAVCRVEGDDVV